MKMERELVSERRAFQAGGKASAKALRQGQGGGQRGWSGWREGVRVVRRRQQMPRGFVSSAKDPTLMRWETAGEH